MIHIFISQGYESEDRNPRRSLGGEKFNTGIRSQNDWEGCGSRKQRGMMVPRVQTLQKSAAAPEGAWGPCPPAG